MAHRHLLVPALVAAGMFSARAVAHDVTLVAVLPGFSVVLGTPLPPQVVYDEATPSPRNVVFYEPAPPPYVYQRVSDDDRFRGFRSRVRVDPRCDHRSAHGHHESRHIVSRHHGRVEHVRVEHARAAHRKPQHHTHHRHH